MYLIKHYAMKTYP